VCCVAVIAAPALKPPAPYPSKSPPVLHPVTGTVASRSDGGGRGVVHHHRARPLWRHLRVTAAELPEAC